MNYLSQKAKSSIKERCQVYTPDEALLHSVMEPCQVLTIDLTALKDYEKGGSPDASGGVSLRLIHAQTTFK
ncbi:MAG: hypothetical protein IEMM0008_1830 [bacterium]|nr:MAG: hypothetical protein IEMM0008_1830 [bacterium]